MHDNVENKPGNKNYNENTANNLENQKSIYSLVILDGFIDHITVRFFDEFFTGLHDKKKG